MHAQLLPSFALHSGNEDESGANLVDERDDFAEKINLDLGIGSCANASGRVLKRNKNIRQEKEETLLSDAQILELYDQILAYNFIKYPSFANIDPHGPDMDPEVGRCRRTDGRKWRCSKNAVPFQKYCERHMHRGRRCSRKHVEPMQSVSRHDNITSDDGKMPIMSFLASSMDDRMTVSDPMGLNPGPPCSDYRKGDEVSKNFNVNYCTNASSHSNENLTTNDGNHCKHSSSDANLGKIGGRKESVARNNYVGLVSPRFGLSPKSVLHCVAGKVSTGLGNKSIVETEQRRCRRTDGKKWQCRREALHNQKYCEAHMHRGAKKPTLNPQSGSNSRTMPRSFDNGINLNTMPASPQQITGDNSTSSTSDATTITDENISFCLAQSLRNC